MTTVLYDIAGPKARARYLTFGVIGAVGVAAVIGFVIYRFAATGQFDAAKWEFIQFKAIQILLLEALLATLQAFAMAAVLSVLFGAVFAAGRLSDRRWASRSSAVIVEFFRAIPLLILIFILYYGVSRAFDITIPAFWALVIGLMLYNGSVLSEVFRAGVQSLPSGQREAAYALGMRKTQVMTNVLLPQALRAMLPTIISQLVVVLKDTALGFIIVYPELLFQARYLGSQPQLGFPILQVALVVAVIYITMCVLLSSLANYLERRSRRGPRQIDVAPKAEAEQAVLVAQAQGSGAATP